MKMAADVRTVLVYSVALAVSHRHNGGAHYIHLYLTIDTRLETREVSQNQQYATRHRK